MIAICPQCKHKLQLPENYLGNGRCPKCQAQIPVPQQPVGVENQTPVQEAAKRDWMRIAPWIGMAIFALLSVGLMLGSCVRSTDKPLTLSTETTPAIPAPVPEVLPHVLEQLPPIRTGITKEIGLGFLSQGSLEDWVKLPTLGKFVIAFHCAKKVHPNKSDDFWRARAHNVIEYLDAVAAQYPKDKVGYMIAMFEVVDSAGADATEQERMAAMVYGKTKAKELQALIESP